MKKVVSLACLALIITTASFTLAADTLNFVSMSSEDPKKEGPKYAALAEYLKAGSPGIGDFRGKKVADTLLASSGEAFVRGLLPAGEKPENIYTPVPSASHLIAINAVQSGAADCAVVKNMVWDPAKFPGLVLVGEDKGENPNNTLIMSNAAAGRHGEDIKRLLLQLEADTGAQAASVKQLFGIKGFIPTTSADFSHTFEIFEKAGINPKTFDFKF